MELERGEGDDRMKEKKIRGNKDEDKCKDIDGMMQKTTKEIS